MNDPIVDEVRRVRDAHAARFHYDLDAIYRDIKEQEKESGRKFVSFAPVHTELNPRENQEKNQDLGCPIPIICTPEETVDDDFQPRRNSPNTSADGAEVRRRHRDNS